MLQGWKKSITGDILFDFLEKSLKIRIYLESCVIIWYINKSCDITHILSMNSVYSINATTLKSIRSNKYLEARLINLVTTS